MAEEQRQRALEGLTALMIGYFRKHGYPEPADGRDAVTTDANVTGDG